MVGLRTSRQYIAVVCTNKTNILLLFVRHKSWYSAVSLGRCSVLPGRAKDFSAIYSCCLYKQHEYTAVVCTP